MRCSEQIRPLGVQQGGKQQAKGQTTGEQRSGSQVVVCCGGEKPGSHFFDGLNVDVRVSLIFFLMFNSAFAF